MILYTIPFISAAIGWFTNYVAIKMLFHPREVRDFKVFKLHGIFPKRKHVLAERLGKVVKKDLFSTEMVKDKLDNEENRAKLKEAILAEMEDYLLVKFKAGNPMLGMFMNEKMVEQIKSRISEMLDNLLPKLMEQITSKVDEVDIEKMVYDKVNNFSNEKLEGILMAVIKKELKFIEIAGGVLGFMIGIFQVALVYFTGGL